MTVSGHAATIDDKGVHVDGTDGPSLSQQLARQGVTIRTVGAHDGHSKTGARSDATALAVDVELPVKGVPYIPNPLPPLPPPFDQVPQLPGVNANGTYVAEVTLGAVGAAAGVGAEPTFDLGGVGQVPPPAAATGTPAAAAPPPSGGGDLVTGLSTPPEQSAPAVANPSQSLLGGFRDLLSKEQLEVLYAVLALGTVGLFVGWRGSMVLSQRRLTGPGRRRR